MSNFCKIKLKLAGRFTLCVPPKAMLPKHMLSLGEKLIYWQNVRRTSPYFWWSRKTQWMATLGYLAPKIMLGKELVYQM